MANWGENRGGDSYNHPKKKKGGRGGRTKKIKEEGYGLCGPFLVINRIPSFVEGREAGIR